MLRRLISKLMIGDIVHKVRSNKNFEDSLSSLISEIKQAGFEVQNIQDVKESFDEENLPVDSDFKYKIVQFCSAKKSHEVLSMSTDVGIMMPKNIIVFQKNSKVYFQFMQMRSYMVSFMFPTINLAPVAREMILTMKRIVANSSV